MVLRADGGAPLGAAKNGSSETTAKTVHSFTYVQLEADLLVDLQADLHLAHLEEVHDLVEVPLVVVLSVGQHSLNQIIADDTNLNSVFQKRSQVIPVSNTEPPVNQKTENLLLSVTLTLWQLNIVECRTQK